MAQRYANSSRHFTHFTHFTRSLPEKGCEFSADLGSEWVRHNGCVAQLTKEGIDKGNARWSGYNIDQIIEIQKSVCRLTTPGGDDMSDAALFQEYAIDDVTFYNCTKGNTFEYQLQATSAGRVDGEWAHVGWNK
jgi:hypothetical protein